MHLIRKLMGNPFFLVFAAGVYPAVFLLSNNWFIYSLQDQFVLLLFTVITVLTMAAIGYALVHLFRLFISIFIVSFRKAEVTTAITNIFFTFYACFILFFLLQSINSSIIPNSFILWTVTFIVSLGLVLFSIKKGTSMFCTFVSVLLLFAIFQFSYSYFSNISKFTDNIWYTKNKDHNKKIIFKHRPNVYLIGLEAYHNKATLKEIYHFDNQDIENKLHIAGFRIYDTFYSNYFTTLASLSSLFTMEHHYYDIAAGNNDSFNARHIIGGKTYNPVVSVFRNNGYKIQFISHSDYSYLTGNVIDYAFPKRTILKVFELYQITLLDNLISHFFPSYHGKDKEKDRIHVNLQQARDEMVSRIRHASQSDTPYFTFMKLALPGHFGKSWDKIDPINSWYPDKIKETNDLMIYLLDIILKDDPDPIVIFVGDHGAFRYRRAWTGKKNIHLSFARKNIPETLVANDLFGVFLAVRYSNHHIPSYELNSTANLMRFIFSYLCDSDIPLDTKVADESYFQYKKKTYTSVRDGKPLARWEIFQK